MDRRVVLPYFLGLLAVALPAAAAPGPHDAPSGAAAAQVTPEGGERPATVAQVTSVRFTGVTRIPVEKLLGLLQTRPGAAFDPKVLERDILKVEEFYRASGFPLAYVQAGGGIDAQGIVTIPVEEGRIERVTVSGSKRTRTSVVLREIGLRPGDVYDARRLASDRERLYRLGFFDSVSISPKAGTEPGKAILDVDVKDRFTGAVSGVVGYAGTAGLVGFFELSDANFLGTGQSVFLNWQRGTYATASYTTGSDTTSRIQTRTGFDAAYYTPWLLHRRFSGGLRYFDTASQQFVYFSQDIDPDNIKTYEWRRGLWGTVSSELGGGTSLGVIVRRENVDYTTAPEDVAPPSGVSVLPARILSVRVNLARGPSQAFGILNATPKTGVYLELGRSESGGASGTYQKLGVTSTQYLTLTRKNTLATRVQFGWSTGSVPFAELFSIGGPSTVRSYNYSRFMGTRMLALNTELRHELRSGLSAALFMDLGYAWPKASQWSLTDLRSAVGLGFRVATPFGPLRMDYAYGRDGGRFHVVTGETF